MSVCTSLGRSRGQTQVSPFPDRRATTHPLPPPACADTPGAGSCRIRRKNDKTSARYRLAKVKFPNTSCRRHRPRSGPDPSWSSSVTDNLRAALKSDAKQAVVLGLARLAVSTMINDALNPPLRAGLAAGSFAISTIIGKGAARSRACSTPLRRIAGTRDWNEKFAGLMPFA